MKIDPPHPDCPHCSKGYPEFGCYCEDLYLSEDLDEEKCPNCNIPLSWQSDHEENGYIYSFYRCLYCDHWKEFKYDIGEE